MRKLMVLLGAASLFGLLAISEDVDAIGRGGGPGGRGGGGSAPRPSPQPARAPTMSRPASSPPRPAPRPAPATHTPSVRPAVVTRPAPSAPKGVVSLPKGGSDFKLPSNFQVRDPKVTQRPAVTRPADVAKLPKAKIDPPGKWEMPAAKKGAPSIPKGKGNLADLQKKTPGVFDRPKADLRPAGKPSSRDDVANWLNLPKDRPGGPATRPGGPATRPPGKDKIKGDFNNNWKKAIGGDKIAIGGKKIGNINVDLSKNYNFQYLSNHATRVQNNFRPVQHNWFNANWWDHHHHPGWPRWHYHYFPRPAAFWWRPCTWGLFTGFLAGASWGPPIYYDYGTNVVIYEEVVYINEQPIASAPVYAQQAIELAEVQPPPADKQIEWLPLGTFALSSKKDDDNPSTVLQLAVSKDGLVSGVWYNRATDTSAPVEGRVDPDTQRIALRKPDEPDTVLEVGVYNLTQVATPCLIHFGTLRTQTWYLTRLENPE